MDETRPTKQLSRDIEHLVFQSLSLRVLTDPDERAPLRTSSNRITIGSDESCDFIFADATMSRFHCEIRVSGGRAMVRDLGSRNGTFIDGVQVKEAVLHDGAVLTLGQTKLRFEVGKGTVEVPISQRNRFGLLVGQSSAARAVFQTLERAAKTEVSVLLQGETGTGKDTAAESIHMESARRGGPLVVVDCASLPPNLLESELFGHERGAFSGAETARTGAFEAAHGGTLFLDEVGELPLELQPKLLRALESHKIQRLGSNRRNLVDVRVVAASCRNLREEVNAHRFRPDLYYRLAVLTVVMPALRERVEDLPLLVEEFLRQRAGAAAAPSLGSERFIQSLAEHSWPGNIRELRNYLERCLTVQGPVPVAETETTTMPAEAPTLRAALADFEREYIVRALEANPGNLSAVARTAGISRIQLYRLLARYGLR